MLLTMSKKNCIRSMVTMHEWRNLIILNLYKSILSLGLTKNSAETPCIICTDFFLPAQTVILPCYSR
jgi:hypothetical protein